MEGPLQARQNRATLCTNAVPGTIRSWAEAFSERTRSHLGFLTVSVVSAIQCSGERLEAASGRVVRRLGRHKDCASTRFLNDLFQVSAPDLRHAQVTVLHSAPSLQCMYEDSYMYLKIGAACLYACMYVCVHGHQVFYERTYVRRHLHTTSVSVSVCMLCV